MNIALIVLTLLATYHSVSHAESELKNFKTLIELRQDKVVVQKWDISCGAAALATLLNYQHGDDVTEKDIAKGLFQREEYLKDPTLVQLHQGFSLLDLKRYVEQRGYAGNGLGKLSVDTLLERAPIMVALNMHGYNHFVVFRGLRGDRVLLADPAWGNRTMTRDKFEDVWIDYPKIGRVGFTVARKDGLPPPNQLAPRDEDFVTLK
jgi:predicted double-glycine peptidase